MDTLLGVVVLCHALAHAGAGMWAAGSPWIVTPLWLVAMCGWEVVAFSLLGVRGSPEAPRVVVIAAAVASVLLLRLGGTSAVSIGGAMVTLVVTILSWRRLTRRHRLALGGLFAEHPPQPPGAPRLRQRLVTAGAAGLLLWTAVVVVTRPWTMTWGSTAAERATALPGDELQEPGGRYHIEHAVTVHAPADTVFAFLAQLGQDRAGFYSYDWLERAFGDDVHNVDSLVPAWQQRRVGELVRATQPNYLFGLLGRDVGWTITRFDPPRVMVLKYWGSFVVVPVDSGRVRLVARTLGAGTPSLGVVPLSPVGMLAFEPAHFIMQRGMLLGIKERAERLMRRGSTGAAGAVRP